MPVELNTEVKARIDAIAARYPRRQAALLPVLHLVQAEYGYLSPDVQMAVAHALDVPPTLVHEVTTFYEMYHQHPEGQFHLEMCTNISCHLQGADALVAHVKKTLGIEVGHQTEDGVFSLMEAECLASCGSGPMLRVGWDYYEFLTPPACDALFKRFREMAPDLKGKHYEHGPFGPHVGPVKGFEPSAALPVVTFETAPTMPPAPAADTMKPQPAVETVPQNVPAPLEPTPTSVGPTAVSTAASSPTATPQSSAPSSPPTTSGPALPAGPALPSFDPKPLKKKNEGDA
jgi:NADH-quinone oxidoreductase subunit E